MKMPQFHIILETKFIVLMLKSPTKPDVVLYGGGGGPEH